MGETAKEKILKALVNFNYSTEELSKRLKLPMGTVRSTLSTLRKQGLVEPVPKEKRGTPFRLTEDGKEDVSGIQ
jgi:DNA-binding transcriptional ArsR family regulator